MNLLNEDHAGRTYPSKNYGSFLAILAVAVLLIIATICAYVLVKTQIDAYSASALVTKCHNISLIISADKHPSTITEHNLLHFYKNEFVQTDCKAVLK